MNIIPKIKDLFQGILSDLGTEYGVVINPSGKSFLRAFAAVQAAKIKLYYLAIGNLQKNIFVDTADPESLGGTLERFGRVKLGRSPFTATPAQYGVVVTGNIGAVIPASSTFKSNDTALNAGVLYVLDNAVTLASTSQLITLRCLTAGLEGKQNIGDELTATAPIANVNSKGIVSTVIIAPLPAEDIETYRALTLASYRTEPQGGAAVDYVLWATGVNGVRRAYAYAKSGAANEINVFVEAQLDASTDGKGTPSGSMITDVADALALDPDTSLTIAERGRRPLGVFNVHTLPVSIKTIDINIAGFTAWSAAIAAQLQTALYNELQAVRPYVAGYDLLQAKNDILDSNKIIGVILATVPGSVFGAITIKVNSVVVPSFTFANGDIPFLNPITNVG